MFCPECGTLAFMLGDGNIRCTKYSCGYEGPLAGKDGKGAEFTDPMTGVTTNLAEARTSADIEFDPSDGSRWKNDKQISPATHRVQKEKDEIRGILYEDSYICPKCDCKKIYVWMQQTRSSDEPETKMCTCSECGHKFREYQ